MLQSKHSSLGLVFLVACLIISLNHIRYNSSIRYWLGHVRTLPVTWGQAVVFATTFLHHLQLASQPQYDRKSVEKSKFHIYQIQCIHLISAPVHRTSASAWLYEHPWIKCQRNKPSTSMNHVACESKLRSVEIIRSYICLGNWVAIGPTCDRVFCPGCPRT